MLVRLRNRRRIGAIALLMAFLALLVVTAICVVIGLAGLLVDARLKVPS